MRNDRRLARLAVAGLCLVFSATPGIPASANEQSQKMVVLTGALRSRTEWGPPGFGETPKVDGKVSIFVLKLLKPQTPAQLSLPPVKKEERHFSEVQLWCDSAAFPRCDELLKKAVGHRITVSGEATRATEPTDYLPVVIHVHLITNQ
jgi:hypothetical protein